VTAEITIVVSLSFDPRGQRRHGRFDVSLQGSDEIICEATQQPLLDASRVLLCKGIDPSTAICKVRSDTPAVVTMRATIGVAAQYDVMGSAFVRRKPAAGPMPSSGIRNDGSAERRVPCETKSNARALHKGSRHAATPATPTSTPSSTSSPAASLASRNHPKVRTKMPT
jgi:hypothetical protein